MSLAEYFSVSCLCLFWRHEITVIGNYFQFFSAEVRVLPYISKKISAWIARSVAKELIPVAVFEPARVKSD